MRGWEWIEYTFEQMRVQGGGGVKREAVANARVSSVVDVEFVIGILIGQEELWNLITQGTRNRCRCWQHDFPRYNNPLKDKELQLQF